MSDGYDWAVGCVECDSLIEARSEAEARRLYASDKRTETRVRGADDRHTITLLRRSRAWDTVTSSAWDGSRDAVEAS